MKKYLNKLLLAVATCATIFHFVGCLQKNGGNEGVQLWENGPYFAECNVGASSPEESGYYFWWGDTVGYKREGDSWNAVDGSMNSYLFCTNNSPTDGKSNSELQKLGYIDSTGNLVSAYDAATAHLGAPWRMPTCAEIKALYENCDTTWVEQNGVRGRLVKGRGKYASKGIFLPAAGNGGNSYLNGLGSHGDYWTSTPYSGDSFIAWLLYFDQGNFSWNDHFRNAGRSVRPVRDFDK